MGPLTGTRLKLLPLIHTSCAAWKREYPKTLVLSADTGFQRDYTRDTYALYAETNRLMFPAAGNMDERLPLKAWIVGVERNRIAN